jgi:peptide-methionine (R)-S-oxide reductase
MMISSRSSPVCYCIYFIVAIFEISWARESTAFHSNLVYTPHRNVVSIGYGNVVSKDTIGRSNKSFLTCMGVHNKNSIDNSNSSNDHGFEDTQRRKLWSKTMVQIASLAVAISAITIIARPVYANQRSRTAGYTIQKKESEWKEQLSPMQYFILREGGTERPGYSILEKEKRSGVYKCAACYTPLFRSNDKFNSGTGWPSFASGISPGVEVESLNPILANLNGAELRCHTCGGHLGDVFNDGFLFIGTEAAITGKRYCIDGAALLFYPDEDKDGVTFIRGDTPAIQSATLPNFLEPPTLNPRN